MNAASLLRDHLELPAGFGTEVCFALFEFSAEDGRSGASLELSASDEGRTEVLVAHSQWQMTAARPGTRSALLGGWSTGKPARSPCGSAGMTGSARLWPRGGR